MILKICDSLPVLAMKMKDMQTGKEKRDTPLSLTVVEEKLIFCKASCSPITASSKFFGYRSIIYVNILDLTYTLCHNVTPEFVLIEMDIYWDKALLLDSSDKSSTCPLSSVCMVGSFLWCGKSRRLVPVVDSLAYWISSVGGNVPVRSSKKTSSSVITRVTSAGVGVSLWETSINSAITGMASRGLEILNSSRLSPMNSLSKSEFFEYSA